MCPKYAAYAFTSAVIAESKSTTSSPVKKMLISEPIWLTQTLFPAAWRTKIADDELVKIVRENFDLRPAGIIKMLDLRRPIYRQTAAYGHFGRNDLNLPWEATNKAEALKKYL